MKTQTNQYQQSTTTGKIKLKDKVELLNRANQGKYPWDRVEPHSICLEAGTEVECVRQETRSGLYYTITYRDAIGNVFEASKKVNNVEYGTKHTDLGDMRWPKLKQNQQSAKKMRKL